MRMRRASTATNPKAAATATTATIMRPLRSSRRLSSCGTCSHKHDTCVQSENRR